MNPPFFDKSQVVPAKSAYINQFFSVGNIQISSKSWLEQVKKNLRKRLLSHWLPDIFSLTANCCLAPEF